MIVCSRNGDRNPWNGNFEYIGVWWALHKANIQYLSDD